ncbi:MAG TPA: MBL fold metallo-hydrolase [Candidatus Saccharimonadales bacterium]|nr:MBL fold metallo-hydrolase [Candidatus Saccharimonadales bacterium]
MELTFYGANCIRLAARKAQIVVDDNLKQLGLKDVTKPSDISLRTNKDFPPHEAIFSAELPGEYEVSGVVIRGIAARAHMDEEVGKSAVIYTIQADDTKVAVLGHIYPELSESQLEQIGLVDVAIVPVGGNGYTLDGAGALKVIRQIEPKVVIPTHYADKAVKYQVPQASLAEALKNLGMEAAEKTAKFKIKQAELSDTARLIVLERQ